MGPKGNTQSPDSFRVLLFSPTRLDSFSRCFATLLFRHVGRTRMTAGRAALLTHPYEELSNVWGELLCHAQIIRRAGTNGKHFLIDIRRGSTYNES